MPGARALRLPLALIPKPTNPFSSSLVLAYSFAAFIILGMFLLMLPASSASGNITHPLDALFTAASAVTLTGLAVVNTATHWSTFGQGVIYALIQIGGLGFILGATLLLLAISGKFGLRDRLLISESLGVDRLSGILSLVLRIAIFALIVEGIGVTVFYFQWQAIGDNSVSLWTAVFHAASAFTNCGLDIFPGNGLVNYRSDVIILLTTAVICIIGSTGYVVIANVLRQNNPGKIAFDSKIILVASLILLVLGTLFYLIAEYNLPNTLGPLPFSEKILVSFFQSVTPRSAGFSVIDIGGLQQITLFFTMFLMIIGGATGSTAGGVKVNTIGTLAITIINVMKGRENISAFGRQITRQTIYRAMTLLIVFLMMIGLILVLLSLTENFPIDRLLFETVSALGTVGLSTGITPELTSAGRFILIFTMFIGRLGPLALIAYLVHHRQQVELEYPHENIRLG